MKEKTRYESRGVSPTKEEVHSAIRDLDKGLYPKAFCKILPDILAEDPEYCAIMHADGAGTKSSLAWAYWKETGDVSVWKGIAQDALVMNTDDLLCVGAVGGFVISSTIGRNKKKVPGEVLSEIIRGTRELVDELNAMGISAVLAGGETADVGDLVRTIIVDSTIMARMPRNRVIDNARIQPGDVVVGFASFGQATYEKEYNSGIGSNGLTSARHDVLNRLVGDRFPESFDPDLPSDLAYTGTRFLTDTETETGLPIGKLLLSPTRTYLPMAKALIGELGPLIHGLVHCSGGGQTKILHYIDTMEVIKDNLFPIPPVFKLIQQESGSGFEEMFRVFNMGHRLEVILPEKDALRAISISQDFGIGARQIGRIIPSEKKKLTIRHENQEIVYDH